MDLSIVIVNYRAWDDLGRCLDSIAALRYRDEPSTEVLVVDNASGGGRAARFRDTFPWARLIESPVNGGFAHGCNLGARQAGGQELLFLNPDCVDPGGAIEAFWRLKQAHRGASILAVRQTDESGSVQRVFESFPNPVTMFGPVRSVLRLLLPRRYPDAKDGVPEQRRVDWVSGSALMISSADLERLGGWAEEYWLYSEDVDLCCCARDAGLDVVFDPSVTLIHRHGGATRQDRAIRTLTKAEVIVSRHLYARRRLPFLSRVVFHTALVVTRYLPRTIAFVLAPGVRIESLRQESEIFKHLSRYYASVALHRTWIGPRSVRHPTYRSRNPDAG